jgi:hypothetical protein
MHFTQLIFNQKMRTPIIAKQMAAIPFFNVGRQLKGVLQPGDEAERKLITYKNTRTYIFTN